jgi:hypothetical protein
MFRTLLGRSWKALAVASVMGFVTSGAYAVTPVVTLTDGNSSSVFNIGTQAGNSSWTVDGVNQLAQQWMWVGLGGAAPESLNNLTNSFLFHSGGVMNTTYTGAGYTVGLEVTLTGGSAHSGTATMAEILTFNNTSDATETAHLYDYADFAVNGLTNNQLTLSGTPVNTADTIGTGGTDANVSVTGNPNHYQVGTGSTILNELNSGSAVTLSDGSVGPITGNANFAMEWDPTVDAGGTFQISIDKTITNGAQPLVPLPSGAYSAAALLAALGGVSLARKAIKLIA